MELGLGPGGGGGLLEGCTRGLLEGGGGGAQCGLWGVGLGLGDTLGEEFCTHGNIRRAWWMGQKQLQK